MLRRLTIEDYNLVAHADIAFAGGATIFTGETGSGKTMVLGSIAFVLGERAGPDVVRRDATRAAVTLEFEADAALRDRFALDGYSIDLNENATISREMTAAGKSALRLNGRLSSAGYVREIAGHIADMVGQHEAQRLLSPAYHVELLDRFGGAEALEARTRVASLFAARKETQRRLAAIDGDERRAQEQVAFAQFALNEIQAAAPQAGEDERLTTRRRILENAEKIALALRAAHKALVSESGAADALGTVIGSLDHVAGIGEQFAQMGEHARALQSETNELASRILREGDELEFDAGELEAINGRLEVLDSLKRKYGGSLDTVIAAIDELNASVDLFANKDERRAEMQHQLSRITAQLDEAAQHLSRLRHGAAERLSAAVRKELAELALPGARLEVQFRPLAEVGPDGAEDVEFVFAANKGEELRRLSKGASGGELSRVLLALVVVLAGARGSTALVFDEIDAGIGGATARAVGVRLARLAQSAQVVCVTHLAQIASWADAHYVLEKSEAKNKATIDIRPVSSAGDRTGEIARMLSGETHDAALKHAQTLLKQTASRRLSIS